MTICKYNTGVTCERHDCEACGWAPNVAERRSAAICAGEEVKVKRQSLANARQVAKIDDRGRTVEVYSSVRMAAAANNISKNAVKQRCEGKPTRFLIDLDGYTFRYID